MKDLRVAAIQMTSSHSPTANLERAGALVRQAADAGAELVLLPEYFAHLADGGSAGVAEAYAPGDADPGHQPIQAALQGWARDCGVWLVAGAMPLSQRPDGEAVAGQRIRSACLVYDEQGVLRARYDKMHLFDVEVDDAARSYRESAGIEPGDAPRTVSTPWGRLGLSICFDLRFPELYRQLAADGAEILLVPSAFTRVTGRAHWLTLLKARAIENGCFVVAANQCGEHSPTRHTWGHSAILDPWGEVLAEAGASEAVLVADLKAERLAEVRAQMPLLEMRRLHP
ncbi:carbon-nitrogen hydrolase family protein [Microbulbifer yueqingensis]|uniref:Nitrilase n=1 Tax=Microbulbifer yueqingensis TaxID=658219 RepID=A0A1G9DE33_9GAMM|nr:carbon-nitrogen hydrolase family protein [Microbulbifer yueqingensis]SDK62100.1 nitrilase [Microbulbifer yueqingensis]